jgi:hypothetical protein
MAEQTGWICPKCGRVYAPHVQECGVCNAAILSPVPPWTNPYPWYPYPWTTPDPWPGYPPIITWTTTTTPATGGTYLA